MTNPLLELRALGQSIWLDDIDRGDLLSGRFERLIDEESFRYHGRVRLSVEEDLPQSQAVLAALEATGIDYEQVTQQLQEEGVQKFIDSFDKLFQCIEDKRKALQEGKASHA
jgi:Transaldolase/Fructose-6-phosphate aldolase